MPEIPPSDHIARLSRRLYDRLSVEVYERVAQSDYGDIRPAHSPVFRQLREGGARAGWLADRAGMTKQSMAYLIEDLTKLGYVAVAPDPADGRARLVSLTRRGKRAEAVLARLSREVEAGLVRRLGEEGVEALRTLLRAATEGADEGG